MKGIEPEMVFKLGKHRFINFNYIDFLSYLSGLSKTEVKRLFKQGAIDIYVPEKEQS
jgi:hypothetical protein